MFSAQSAGIAREVVVDSSEDAQENGPTTLFGLQDVHSFVVELRWEIGTFGYSDMLPHFLPFLSNLTSLAILQMDDGVNFYPFTVPHSLTREIIRLQSLRDLQLDDFKAFAYEAFDLGAELPELHRLALGGWWNHEEWQKKPSSITDLHYNEDWLRYLRTNDGQAIFRYLPFLKHLTLDCYFGAPSSRSQGEKHTERRTRGQQTAAKRRSASCSEVKVLIFSFHFSYCRL